MPESSSNQLALLTLTVQTCRDQTTASRSIHMMMECYWWVMVSTISNSTKTHKFELTRRTS